MADTNAPPKKHPLFERLGGMDGVRAAVGAFYKRVLADPQLAPFFEGVDMAKQQAKQIAFMKYAFGGSENYAGKDLATAHEHLIREKGLNVKHFDLVAGHFVDAMHEVGVAQEHIDDAVVVLMSTRPIFDTVAKN